MPSKGGGGKEQRENPNAIKRLTTWIKNNQKWMTLTSWSHGPAEDPKRPTKTPSN